VGAKQQLCHQQTKVTHSLFRIRKKFCGKEKPINQLSIYVKTLVKLQMM